MKSDQGQMYFMSSQTIALWLLSAGGCFGSLGLPVHTFSVSSLPCFVPFPRLNLDMTYTYKNKKTRKRKCLWYFSLGRSHPYEALTPLGLEGLGNSLWESWSPGKHPLDSLVVIRRATSLCYKSIRPAPNIEKLTVWARSAFEERYLQEMETMEPAHWERRVRMQVTAFLLRVVITGSLEQASLGGGVTWGSVWMLRHLSSCSTLIHMETAFSRKVSVLGFVLNAFYFLRCFERLSSYISPRVASIALLAWLS